MLVGPIQEFAIMSLPRPCRLCVNISTDLKSLYDENGHATELYEITLKYFHPTILDMEKWKHLNGVCSQCWRHIYDFQDFQLSIVEAQTKLVDLPQHGGIAIKTEVEDHDPIAVRVEGDDEHTLINYDISKKEDVEEEFKESLLGVCNDTPVVEEDKRFIVLPELELIDVHEHNRVSSDDDRVATSRDGSLQAIPTGDGCALEEDDENLSYFNITNVDSDADRSDNADPLSRFPYKCQFSRDELDEELAKFMPNLVCAVCSQPWSKYSLLRKHYHHSHPNEKLFILCCKRKLGTPYQVEEHLRLHNDPDAFKCEQCGKSFTLKSSLKRHMAKRHPKALDAKVDICNRESSDDGRGDTADATAKAAPLQAIPTGDGSASEEDDDNLSYFKVTNVDSDLDLNMSDNADTLSKFPYKRQYSRDALDEQLDKVMPNLTCDVCSEPCFKYSVLRKHYHHQHPNEKLFILCCTRKLGTPYQVEEHLRLHNDPEAFKCELCDKSFTLQSSLKRHRARRHSKALERDSSDDERVGNSKDVILHAIPTGDDGTVSEEDDENLSYFNDAEPNMPDNVDTGGKLPYKCQYSSDALDDQLAKLMPNINCDVCSVPCSKYSSLRQHFNQSHPNDKFYILCCKRRLSTPYQLEEHLRLHNDPEAFKCEVCGKSFTLKSSLNRHMANGHTKALDTKTYVSNRDSSVDTADATSKDATLPAIPAADGGTASEEDDVNVSYFKITEVDSDAEPNMSDNADTLSKLSYRCQYNSDELDDQVAKLMPNLNCSMCSQSYSKYSLLREHFHQHHPNEKLYILCCKRKLGTQYRLEEHLRLHNDPDAYKCELCRKSFTLKSSLKRHMAKRHPKAMATKIFVYKKGDKSFDTKRRLWRHHNVKKPKGRRQCSDNEEPSTSGDKSFDTKRRLWRHHNVKKPKNRRECPDNEEPSTSGVRKLPLHVADKTTIEVKSECAADSDVPLQYDESAASIKDKTAEPIKANAMLLSCDDSAGHRLAQKIKAKRKRKMSKLDDLVFKWMPNIKCVRCPMSYTKLLPLADHFQQTHPGERFYISCCNRKLPGPFQIEEHFLFHNDPDAFKCQICGMQFTIRSSLIRHKAVQHHEASRDTCTNCGKRFGGERALAYHRRVCLPV